MNKLLVVLIALPFFAFKCDKSSSDEDGYLRGKVVRISCASYVIQVLNNDTIGEDGWKDVRNNDAVYDNVFSANNPCKIASEIKAGDVIRFKIAQPTPTECVTCFMYDAPPNTRLNVNDVMLVIK